MATVAIPQHLTALYWPPYGHCSHPTIPHGHLLDSDRCRHPTAPAGHLMATTATLQVSMANCWPPQHTAGGTEGTLRSQESPTEWKTGAQVHSFHLQQTDSPVPIGPNGDYQDPIMLSQSQAEKGCTPQPFSLNKPSSGPAAIHYTLQHCSTACTDTLKRI